MAAMLVRNTFVEMVDEDAKPIKSRPWATFDVFGTAGLSDQDTDAESQSSDNEALGSSEDVPELAGNSESEPEVAEHALTNSEQELLEKMAHENIRLLRENALLRNPQPMAMQPPGSFPAVADGSQWIQMHFQVPVFAAASPVLSQPSAVQQTPNKETSASRRRRQRVKAAAEHVSESRTCSDMPPSLAESRTTVMLRNLPREYSRDMLVNLLDSRGFSAKYDFVYMPIDFVRKASLGYAFVNLISANTVSDFWTAFEGFKEWNMASLKVCKVSWSDPHQGLEEHVNRYRNSPLLHKDVPDECRPILMQNGVRIAFPPPTKSLRAPRLRASRQRNPFWNSAVAPEDGEEEEQDEQNEQASINFKTFDVFG